MILRLICILVGVALVNVAHAETLQFVCEFWNPRLGRMNDDLTLAVDLEMKRCNGDPCTVTDSEVNWTSQGGRYVGTLNRLTGEGQIARESIVWAVLKECRVADAKR